MDTTLSVLVLVLLAGVSATGNLCPPVEEGKPLTLVCTGNANGASLLRISWEESNNNGNGVLEVASCSQTCRNSIPNYQAAIYRENNSFKSELTITQVNPALRNVSFTCTRSNGEFKSKVEPIFTCLMNVRHMPKSKSCQLRQLETSEVQVSCEVSLIYPGTFCYFQQQDPLNTSLVRGQEDVAYTGTRTGEGNAEYLDIKCSITFHPAMPGQYSYTSKVYYSNRIGNGREKDRIYTHTESLMISERPSVSLEYMPGTTICPDTNSVTMVCKALYFPSRPTFHWSSDDLTLFKNTIDVENDSDNTGPIYFTKYTISRGTWDHVSHVTVTCTASLKNNSEEQSNITESMNLAVPWPVFLPPRFQDRIGNDLGDCVDIEAGENVEISCRAASDDVNISNLTVRCWSDEDHRNPVNDQFVSFSIHGDPSFNNSECICVVYHYQRCYDIQINITIHVRNNAVSVGSKADRVTDNFSGEKGDDREYITTSIYENLSNGGSGDELLYSEDSGSNEDVINVQTVNEENKSGLATWNKTRLYIILGCVIGALCLLAFAIMAGKHLRGRKAGHGSAEDTGDQDGQYVQLRSGERSCSWSSEEEHGETIKGLRVSFLSAYDKALGLGLFKSDAPPKPTRSGVYVKLKRRDNSCSNDTGLAMVSFSNPSTDDKSFAVDHLNLDSKM